MVGPPAPRSTGPVRLGRYELLAPIGRGGMAEVHLAMQRGPGGFEKLVVVKLLHDKLATNKELAESLLDEARLAAMIKHPNVIDMYDLGEADGRYFIAMEYLEGEPLLHVLREATDGKTIDPLSMGRILADTAEGLDAAHRLKGRDGKPLGLVHHDVSLGNIVVLYTGQVKLVDFGVAKAASSLRTDRVQGKFSYMAPEKLAPGRTIDKRSDIWSLGCVAWEAFALTRLFKGGSDAETVRSVIDTNILPPSAVNGAAPRDFDPIIMRALERDPEKRYPTAKAMAQDLEEVLRKRGYGAKNDRIAEYMESTFEAHIKARDRLLDDVRGGRPSEQVIEAAFAEPATVSEFTMTSTGPSPVTVRPSALHDAQELGPPARKSDPSWATHARAGAINQLQQQLDSKRRTERLKRRFIPIGIGVALLLVVIIVVATREDGEAPKIAAKVAGVAPTIADPPAPPPVVPAAAVVPIDARPAEASIEDAPVADDQEIIFEPTVAKKHHRQPSPNDAIKLYAKGIDQLAANDAKAALASLTEARRANPSFAPAWYGLGLVHERLGSRASAKKAYERYLQLAPNAANAAQVRQRLVQLK